MFAFVKLFRWFEIVWLCVYWEMSLCTQNYTKTLILSFFLVNCWIFNLILSLMLIHTRRERERAIWGLARFSRLIYKEATIGQAQYQCLSSNSLCSKIDKDIVSLCNPKVKLCVYLFHPTGSKTSRLSLSLITHTHTHPFLGISPANVGSH